jgi:hypothetical protein
MTVRLSLAACLLARFNGADELSPGSWKRRSSLASTDAGVTTSDVFGCVPEKSER